MDVEKTIEFLLEQQARFDARMELLLEQQARFDGRIESLSGIVTEMAGGITNGQHQLRRAIKLGVEEARRERAQRRALEQKVDTRFGELATAQLATERSLQRLIHSLQLATEQRARSAVVPAREYNEVAYGHRESNRISSAASRTAAGLVRSSTSTFRCPTGEVSC